MLGRAGYGSTGGSRPAARPTLRAAAAAAASASGSRRPRQATSVPPTASSGAAYSTTTSSGASARAVTTSNASRPSGQCLGAGVDDRGVVAARIAATARSRNAHLRAALSTSANRGVRQRDRQRQAREARRRDPRSATVPRVSDLLELERDQRVGQVVVDRLRRVAHRRRRERIVGEQAAQQSLERGRSRPPAGRSGQSADLARTSSSRHVNRSRRARSRRDERRVALAHRREALGGVAVEPPSKLLLEQRQDVAHERRAARHPLVVGAPAVVVRARTGASPESARPASGTAPRGAYASAA